MRGPYVNEDYSEVLLPVTEYTFNAARHEAASWAQEFIDTWGRSRYTGKRTTTLHDHADWEECTVCPPEVAWCFDVYEGTPKWR